MYFETYFSILQSYTILSLYVRRRFSIEFYCKVPPPIVYFVITESSLKPTFMRWLSSLFWIAVITSRRLTLKCLINFFEQFLLFRHGELRFKVPHGSWIMCLGTRSSSLLGISAVITLSIWSVLTLYVTTEENVRVVSHAFAIHCVLMRVCRTKYVHFIYQV